MTAERLKDLLASLPPLPWRMALDEIVCAEDSKLVVCECDGRGGCLEWLSGMPAPIVEVFNALPELIERLEAVDGCSASESNRYRSGHKLGRTIYRDGKFIGIMDSAADAKLVIDAMNRRGCES